MKFALFFGNRGFMPGELITGARADMIKAVTDAGYDYIVMDENLTRYGAIETRDEAPSDSAVLESPIIRAFISSRLFLKSVSEI